LPDADGALALALVDVEAAIEGVEER